tara:strand:- start:627 stop:1229 length:603 start_codon:yes stop_codon:yes gene_type:complete
MPNKKKNNKQKGGNYYGFTKQSLSNIGPIKNSHAPVQNFKSCGSTQRGGGLVGSPIKGNIGSRPSFMKPGYGFNNPAFVSTPPNVTSYESGGCPKVGGRRKRTRRRNKRRKRRTKRRRRRKTNKKRNNKRRKRRTKRKRRLFGCGQKGGNPLDGTAPNITSFPGKPDVSMATPNSLPNVKTIGNAGYFKGPLNTYKHTGH